MFSTKEGKPRSMKSIGPKRKKRWKLKSQTLLGGLRVDSVDNGYLHYAQARLEVSVKSSGIGLWSA